MSQTVHAAEYRSNGFSPEVSVIVPTYNRKDLVCHAIESALHQSYKDYEIIVIDDGSTDNTRGHLQQYLDRIKYLYQPNRGVSAALNAGVRAAEGEWIAVLSSDDLWHPDKLEMQIKAVESLGPEFGACFTDCEFAYPGETHATAFQSSGLDAACSFGPVGRPLLYMTGHRYAFFVQSILVKRSLINEVGGFDETLVIAEDLDLVYRLSLKTRFCYVSGKLVTIDRNPAVQRLSELCSDRHTEIFTWNEMARTRILPYLDDQEVRHLIEADLTELYFGWAATAAQALDMKAMGTQVKKLRQLGASHFTIWKTLIIRASSKMLRNIHSRRPSSRLK